MTYKINVTDPRYEKFVLTLKERQENGVEKVTCRDFPDLINGGFTRHRIFQYLSFLKDGKMLKQKTTLDMKPGYLKVYTMPKRSWKGSETEVLLRAKAVNDDYIVEEPVLRYFKE